MSVILRGGNMQNLSPGEFTQVGAQVGGLLVAGSKYSSSGKRSGSKRMRGGNSCGAANMPGGMVMTPPSGGGSMSPAQYGGNFMVDQMGGMITPPSGGGRRTRRGRKARHHRTKSYRARGKKRKTRRARK